MRRASRHLYPGDAELCPCGYVYGFLPPMMPGLNDAGVGMRPSLPSRVFVPFVLFWLQGGHVFSSFRLLTLGLTLIVHIMDCDM